MPVIIGLDLISLSTQSGVLHLTKLALHSMSDVAECRFLGGGGYVFKGHSGDESTCQGLNHEECKQQERAIEVFCTKTDSNRGRERTVTIKKLFV